MSLAVNGIPLDEQEVIEEIALLRPRHDEVFNSISENEREGQLRAWAQENVIERMLLRQAAEKFAKGLPRGLVEEAFHSLVAKEGGPEQLWQKLSAKGISMEKFRREFEQQFWMERLVGSVAGNVPRPGEEEIRRRYEADPLRFTTPEIVRAGHIVRHVDGRRTREKALEEIREIQRMLNEGRDFEDLAARFSDCPENDGDMGWLPKGEGEFESAVFAMATGEVSGIIETPLGFHIAKLYEKRAGSIQPFEEVKDILLAERVREIRDQLFENFVDSLRAAATIMENP